MKIRTKPKKMRKIGYFLKKPLREGERRSSWSMEEGFKEDGFKEEFFFSSGDGSSAVGKPSIIMMQAKFKIMRIPGKRSIE